jgi:hypothetical protein
MLHDEWWISGQWAAMRNVWHWPHSARLPMIAVRPAARRRPDALTVLEDVFGHNRKPSTKLPIKSFQ